MNEKTRMDVKVLINVSILILYLIGGPTFLFWIVDVLFDHQIQMNFRTYLAGLALLTFIILR